MQKKKKKKKREEVTGVVALGVKLFIGKQLSIFNDQKLC
jgi:hypothetical protein